MTSTKKVGLMLSESIKATISTIKKLDDEIIEVDADGKDSSEAEVTKEIQDTSLDEMLFGRDKADTSKSSETTSTSTVQETGVTYESPSTSGVKIRAKLPVVKLKVKRFVGNVC